MTDISKDLSDLRREYSSRPLRRADLLEDPIAQFDRWFNEAMQAQLPDPSAMSVASVSADGQPSSRMVLLKFFDQRGFVFYTNLGSRKAGELTNNPRAALLFFWPELHRQVKIRGTVARTTAAESISYFLRRPRDSQISAWISSQSQPVSSRQLLAQQFAQMKQKYAGGEIPVPDSWGGFRVQPAVIEFWQGQEMRLHDRFCYTRSASGWAIERLAP